MRLWADMREWLDREYPGKVLIAEWGVPEQSLLGRLRHGLPSNTQKPGASSRLPVEASKTNQLGKTLFRENRQRRIRQVCRGIWRAIPEI